ncbi:MAG: hypothetical protein ACYTEI_04895 [Planctomycetota bacterium]|jgi:hypothetical protein
MIGRLPAKTAYLLGGTAAAAAATWLLPVWPVQPSVPSTAVLMNEADAAIWAPIHRAETGLCFALNAAWCTAAVWLIAETATLVRGRAPARPSSWRRT